MCLFQTQLQQNQSKLSPNPDAGNATSSNGQNAVKLEQKPVECNLCHRKFKNIPALNGHMRLHGGYFKKDAEPKKCDKKDTAGPPLQTASIGIRALIEEKIISKRGKDIKVSICIHSSTRTVPGGGCWTNRKGQRTVQFSQRANCSFHFNAIKFNKTINHFIFRMDLLCLQPP